MRRGWIVAGLGALALATAGCSGCSVLKSGGFLSETKLDERALWTAEAAFFGANAAAEAAVDGGLIKGGSPEAIKIADGLAAAHGMLDAARKAYALGDAATFGSKVSAAQSLVSSIWATIPKKEVV